MIVLVVKMSSLGDVVHTLPAISDLTSSVPDVLIDWVVEEAYVDIVRSHSGVRDVIPIAIRRWRKSPLSYREEINRFFKRLRETNYDVVVDAQGLMKSAIVSLMAKGSRHGPDRKSAREPLASFFYHRGHRVDKKQHAVVRQRQLFSSVFGYSPRTSGLEYGLMSKPRVKKKPYLMFLHGTTWPSKHWPEQRWYELAVRAVREGYDVVLPHGDETERLTAQRIADRCADADAVNVLTPGSIARLIDEIGNSSGIVSVDTGLGHLAAALNIPVIGIYGATDPLRTGFLGSRQDVIVSDHLPCIPCLKKECRFPIDINSGNIHPPCYTNMTADMVFDRLLQLMKQQVKDDTA